MMEALSGLLFIFVVFGGAASYGLLKKCASRRVPNSCDGCGYSLAGISMRRVCPECGLKVGSIKSRPYHPWIVMGTTILWGVVGFIAIVTIFAWRLGSTGEGNRWDIALLFLSPAILVPCFVAFWFGARGAIMLANVAGFGFSSILIALVGNTAVALRQDAMAGVVFFVAPVLFPMIMGWGSWLPFVVYSFFLKREQ